MQPQSFDYIVIGGGSAGSVMAGRLSEHAGTSVALLEAGGKGDSWMVKTPAAAVAMLPTSINNYAYETVPQKGLNGRRGYQPRGKCLGGSSAINAMIYTRGHRYDYDHWAALGNQGWSYCPISKKVKTTPPLRINFTVTMVLYLYPICSHTILFSKFILMPLKRRASQ
jgi:choline dehydrogenase-like flavoprotein